MIPYVDISISIVKCIIAPFINHHATSVTNMVVVNHRQHFTEHVAFDVSDCFPYEVHFEELIQSFKDCQSYLYLHHGEDYGNPYALVVVDFHVHSPVVQSSSGNTGGRLVFLSPVSNRWSLVAHRNVSNAAFRCSRVTRQNSEVLLLAETHIF